jgi:hypothetical protein
MANANNFLQLDEKNHVEEPFLHQLEAMHGIKWQVLQLAVGSEQTPAQTHGKIFILS